METLFVKSPNLKIFENIRMDKYWYIYRMKCYIAILKKNCDHNNNNG